MAKSPCDHCGKKREVHYSSRHTAYEYDAEDDCEYEVPVLLCADCEYK